MWRTGKPCKSRMKEYRVEIIFNTKAKDEDHAILRAVQYLSTQKRRYDYIAKVTKVRKQTLKNPEVVV